MYESKNNEAVTFFGMTVHGQFAAAIQYGVKGDTDKALECIKSHITYHPDDIDAYYMQAKLLEIQGRHEDALASINSVWNPDSAVLYMIFQKAELYAGLGDRRNALDTIALADGMSVSLAPLHYHKSLVLMHLGKSWNASAYTEASKYILKACRLNKEHAAYHSTAALIFYQVHYHDDASDIAAGKTAYRHAQMSIKYGHETTQEHNIMGQILIARGKYAQAAKHFRWMLERNPNDVDTMYMLGWCMANQNNMSDSHYKRAVGYLDAALGADASNVDSHRAKITALTWLGDLWGLQSALTALTKAAPDDAEALLRLGCVHSLIWDTKGGIKKIKKAVKMDPDLGKR